jgi:hypothetical protein
VYDEPPSQGGTLLRSADFAPLSYAFSGGSFEPLQVSAGEDFFIGFRNVAQLGSNFTVAPNSVSVSNLYFGYDNTGTYPIESWQPEFTQVILQFRDDQPDPCEPNETDPCVVDSFNADKGPSRPWPYTDVGWLYTPKFSYTLTGVSTRFGDGDSRLVTLEVYDDLPRRGGTLLRSATLFSVPHMLAGSTFEPLAINACQNYFIGFRNVEDLGANYTSEPNSESVSHLHFSFGEHVGSYRYERVDSPTDQAILEFKGERTDPCEPNQTDHCRLGPLDPDRSYRGIAFLSSNINNSFSLDEIREFLARYYLDFVVIDFAWITYHWPRTDLAAVEQFTDELVHNGVQVAVMYRPRALSPNDTPIHYAQDCNGTIDPNHNHLCFAHEDSVAWGTQWGTDILNALPSVNKVIIYNLLAPCCCELCRVDEHAQGALYAEQFMERCRSEWDAVRPGVQIGHVGMGAEYAGQVDFFCPFLSINREPGHDDRYVDVRGLLNQIFDEELHKGVLVKADESSTGNGAVYFASKESTEGQRPLLELHHDLDWLGVNMAGDDRILFNFDLRAVPPDAVLERAELVLDMTEAYLPPVEYFDLGVHKLIGCWSENQRFGWSDQPAFESEPSAIAAIDPDPGIKRLDITDIVRDLILLEIYDKPVIPFAKTCWEPYTENTTEDIIYTIYTCDYEQTGFMLWYYDWIFHDETMGYDTWAIGEALWGEIPTNPPNSRVYFESSESTEGQHPLLRLTFNDGNEDIAASEDTLLLSYLPDQQLSWIPTLGIDMNDTYHPLLAFSLSSIGEGATLERAELILDMKQTVVPTVAPFNLAVHAVTESWSDETATWNTQPAYPPNDPDVVASIDPRPGLKVIDITIIVSDWLEGTMPNYGLLLKVAEQYPRIPYLTFPYAQQSFEPLPWPHQAPDLTPQEIELLNQQVWVINDFPLYQADEEGWPRYFHGGLDIVLDNGTPIYAMKDGWVKFLDYLSGTIAITDMPGDEPSYGWEYTHLGNFQVEVGDFVTAGTFIGEVDFPQGLAHIHLTKDFS